MAEEKLNANVLTKFTAKKMRKNTSKANKGAKPIRKSFEELSLEAKQEVKQVLQSIQNASDEGKYKVKVYYGHMQWGVLEFIWKLGYRQDCYCYGDNNVPPDNYCYVHWDYAVDEYKEIDYSCSDSDVK